VVNTSIENRMAWHVQKVAPIQLMQTVRQIYDVDYRTMQRINSGGSRPGEPTGAAARDTKGRGHQRGEERAKITRICITKNVGAQSGNLAQAPETIDPPLSVESLACYLAQAERPAMNAQRNSLTS